MQIKYLVQSIRNIAGYHENTSARVNDDNILINDNMIFSAINEAQRFICQNIVPEAFNIPLSIDLNTDLIGADLVRPKLSSFNEGSKPDPSSTIIGSEKLQIPNKQKSCYIFGINDDSCHRNYGIGFYGNRSFEIVYSQDKYIRGSSMSSVGSVSVNRYKSVTLQNDFLSTFKTNFILRDKNNNLIDTYSITTESNVYSFYIFQVRISVNYRTGLIVCSYEGLDNDEYYIEVETMKQPSNIAFFHKGILRIANQRVAQRLGEISIRISPYAIYDPTQEVSSIYDEDLIEILAYKSALELQRFNRSTDQSLVDIVSNKIDEYQSRERFKTMEAENDIVYPSSF